MNYTRLVCLLLPLLASCRGPVSETIDFYLVSERPFHGSTSVKPARIQTVGYISQLPDLQIRQLEFLDEAEIPWTEFDPKMKPLDSGSSLRLEVGLLRSDATALEKLIQTANGRRILIQVGGTPLAAFAVSTTRPTRGTVFALTFSEEAQRESVESVLRRFVSSKDHNSKISPANRTKKLPDPTQFLVISNKEYSASSARVSDILNSIQVREGHQELTEDEKRSLYMFLLTYNELTSGEGPVYIDVKSSLFGLLLTNYAEIKQLAGRQHVSASDKESLGSIAAALEEWFAAEHSKN